MYSESDIDGAVTAGALSPQAAEAFRRHVAAAQAAPAVDEEHFRLLTGFNDIFVSIAILLLLVAVAQIGSRVAPHLPGAFVAATAWGWPNISRRGGGWRCPASSCCSPLSAAWLRS